MSRSTVAVLLSFVLLAACGNEQCDPYPAAERGQNIFYAAFTERPKHLDPARSYAEDGSIFTARIYEPPLQYHYLKRPYTLAPGTADAVPEPQYFDAAGKPFPAAVRVDRFQRLYGKADDGIEAAPGRGSQAVWVMPLGPASQTRIDRDLLSTRRFGGETGAGIRHQRQPSAHVDDANISVNC